jgi:heme exporter protein D
MPEVASILFAAVAFALAFAIVRVVVTVRAKRTLARAQQQDLAHSSRQVRRAKKRKDARQV